MFDHWLENQSQTYTLTLSPLSCPLCMHIKYELMTRRKLFNVQFEMNSAKEVGIDLHVTRTQPGESLCSDTNSFEF